MERRGKASGMGGGSKAEDRSRRRDKGATSLLQLLAAFGVSRRDQKKLGVFKGAKVHEGKHTSYNINQKQIKPMTWTWVSKVSVVQ